MKNKRAVDIVVISDVHLGTYGCHAKELLFYLKSIKAQTIILNGDIIDIWQFNKRYFPKSHLKVIKHLLGLIAKGTNIIFIPGNHDETIRRFAGFELGSFKIENKILLPLPNGEKAWVFHGDVFDVTMQHSKWLARLGAIGYDLLIVINSFANFVSEKVLKRGKISLSKKIKASVKSAVKFINDFEDTAATIGIENGYQYVICGHIHHPEIKTITTTKGSIIYLNSGDWVENLTALEFFENQWTIHQFSEEDFLKMKDGIDEESELNNSQLFKNLLQEFNLLKTK